MQNIRTLTTNDLAVAAGIGTIAGLRSMTAPAMVAWAMNRERIRVPRGKLDLLVENKSVAILSALAIGELIVDKLPNTPKRTAPAGLIGRIAAGALAGAALCASRRGSTVKGAIFGGLGAVTGAFLGYYVRKQVGERLNLKDTVVAVAEDAIAVGGGLLLAS